MAAIEELTLKLKVGQLLEVLDLVLLLLSLLAFLEICEDEVSIVGGVDWIVAVGVVVGVVEVVLVDLAVFVVAAVVVVGLDVGLVIVDVFLDPTMGVHPRLKFGMSLLSSSFSDLNFFGLSGYMFDDILFCFDLFSLA